MIDEFKKFISRGNVMDMAVGVIIGGAFTAIVNSLVNDILMPILGGITGGLDFTAYAFTIGEASVNYGTFIQAIVNFLLVALSRKVACREEIAFTGEGQCLFAVERDIVACRDIDCIMPSLAGSVLSDEFNR